MDPFYPTFNNICANSVKFHEQLVKGLSTSYLIFLVCCHVDDLRWPNKKNLGL